MMRFRLLRLRIALLAAVLFAMLTVNRISLGNVSESYRHKAFNFSAPAPVNVSTFLVGDAKEVFQKINFQRKSAGLKPLVWDERLAELALAYSKQMADEAFFSHFDPAGRSIVDRAEAYEIKDWLKLGENLHQSKGYIDPMDLAVESWMESSSHYENIIDPEWTHTGVGVYKTKDRRTYITQAFMMR